VNCYNHQHRHSGIKFVTPQQRHSGEAIAICQERADVYKQARLEIQNTGADIPAAGGNLI
jgi:hypothetical protein